MRRCGVADPPAQSRKMPGCRVCGRFFQLGRTGVDRRRYRVRRYRLRVVIRVQQGHQRYHEPAVDGVVTVVVYKLERLGARYQVPLADAVVLLESPFEQADPTLAVVSM